LHGNIRELGVVLNVWLEDFEFMGGGTSAFFEKNGDIQDYIGTSMLTWLKNN